MSDLQARVQQSLSGSYTLERELGGGGMSRVFVANEHQLGRKVVVKVLSPELAASMSTTRFEREIRVAASLQQANIVPVFAAGNLDGLPYYTMPYVEGESLRARLGRGPLSIADVVSILRDVTRALAYAHEHGVVHRDIKPDNVLISGHTAVVTDFGIAKAIEAAAAAPANSTSLTQLGTSIGTPAYMAPEQAAGDPATDHRADIYAFGGMAYELLAGLAPFAGLPAHKLLGAHMSETPRSVVELRVDCPPALASLVMQCLAKDPGMRPANATEVLQRLDAVASPSSAQAAMPAILLGGRGMLGRALAVYAAAFVGVAIVARAAIVGIGLPDWVFTGSLVVMALGLPVILFTAYTQYIARRVATATPTYTPGGTPSLPAVHGTMATLAIKASPHVSWQRTMRGGVMAVTAFMLLVGGYMALRVLGIGPAGSLLASGKLSASDKVLVSAFDAPGSDSSLGATIGEAVRTNLSQSKAMHLVPTSAVIAALERDPSVRIAQAYARLGAAAKARELMNQHEARLDATRRRQEAVSLARLRGSIAQAEGKADSAVAWFRAGDAEADGLPTADCAVCTVLGIGMSFDRGGQSDSARKYLTQYVDMTGGSRQFVDRFFLASALFRLGELYENVGDPKRATDYYGRFVDLWAKADPELQPRVALARSRIDHLNRTKR